VPLYLKNQAGEPLVTFAEEGEVVVLRLNRPERLNAISLSMVEAIVAALSDPRVQEAPAVVVGHHGRAFCAGADLKEGLVPETGGDDDLRHVFDELQSITRLMGSARGVIVAAVGGYAVGGGAEIALGADLVVMAPDAQMRFPEVTIGYAPTGGITYRLPKLVGFQRAKELLLTGRWIGAEEAERLGLAIAVADDPHERALAIATDIAAGPRRAATSTKRAIETNTLTAQEWAMQSEVDAAFWLFKGPEAAATLENFRDHGTVSGTPVGEPAARTIADDTP
jgi:enoyl-CoA hydratase/carnithine racemase